MVMTFTLTPLSHYKSMTKPRAHFLLSLLKDLFVDFLSHFITSILNVYHDMATRDKLIFPSRGSFATSPSSFLTLLISPLWVPSASVLFNRTRPSFQLKRPWTKTTDHADLAAPSSSTPSTSAPSSSVAGVTLEAIMA